MGYGMIGCGMRIVAFWARSAALRGAQGWRSWCRIPRRFTKSLGWRDVGMPFLDSTLARDMRRAEFDGQVLTHAGS